MSLVEQFSAKKKSPSPVIGQSFSANERRFGKISTSSITSLSFMFRQPDDEVRKCLGYAVKT